MQLIKEVNGWKLFKGDNLNEFTVETPEGFTKYYKHYNIDNFDRVVQNGWIWLDRKYFTGHIENHKIKTEERSKQIQSNKHELFLSTHHTTKESVIKSLNPILIKATRKFETCKEAFVALQEQLDFDVDYTMLGDTYGIYEDYLHISFKIDDVFCKFRLGD